MRTLNSYIANLKRLIKSPKIWGPFVLLPALLFLLFFFMFNGGSETAGHFGLIVEDKGSKSQEIVELFGDEPTILTREEAEKELKSYNIKLIYVIDENFSQDIENNIKPRITKLFLEDSGYQIEDTLIKDRIRDMMEENYLSRNELEFDREKLEHSVDIEIINNKTDMDFTSHLIMLTVCYITILLSGGIGSDLIQMGKNKILSRVLTTPNTNVGNMMGIFLSYFTLLATTFNIMVMIGYKMLDVEINQIIYTIISVTAIVAFTLGLILLIVRYSQNESMISIIPLITSMIMFLSEIFYMTNKTILPSIVGKLMYINPLFWVQRTMETSNLVNIVPVFLMSIVLLTFGSYRLDKLKSM